MTGMTRIDEEPIGESTQIVKWTFATFILLICAGIVCWMLKVRLDTSIAWLATSAGGFVYWTTAKVFVWILRGS